eukprot:2572270-Pleurochrysis_carterae.AAC.1
MTGASSAKRPAWCICGDMTSRLKSSSYKVGTESSARKQKEQFRAKCACGRAVKQVRKQYSITVRAFQHRSTL